MTVSFNKLNCPPGIRGYVYMNRTSFRTKLNPSMALQLSSVLVQVDESGDLPKPKKILSTSIALKRSETLNSLHSLTNTVGIIGGVSVFSTLIFLEKLVWWSSRNGKECIPFIVSSDPTISRQISFPFLHGQKDRSHLTDGSVVENLRIKRAFLEKSGVRCIVMPCHVCNVWYREVSEGCSVPFLNLGDCVANELKEAKLKPLETGSRVRIGVIATSSTSVAAFYQEKVQSQGLEVVLPDKATMEHIVIPATEALKRKDKEGARNLLRIAIQILLVQAVNNVILASDEFQGLLPSDDPLLKKCIDPMNALARSTIKWAQSTKKMSFDSNTSFIDLLNGGSNLDDQTEDHSINLCDEASKIPPSSGSTTKKTPRNRKYSIDEDNLLVSAWLNTSMDAVHGNEQKSKTYLQRIYNYFHQYKTFPSDRNSNSLSNRWSTIQLAVNKFCRCYAQTKSTSGGNEQDKILRTKLLYHELYSTPFQFEHCWNELRYQPKWLEIDQKKKKAKKRPTSSPRTSSPYTPESINLGEDDQNGEAFAELDMPLGRKAAKEIQRKLKNKKGEGDSPVVSLMKEMRVQKEKESNKKLEYLERTYAQEQERIALKQLAYAQEQEKISLKQRELEMEQEDKDERIMSIDVSTLPPHQAEYYRIRQSAILEKRCRSTVQD